MRQVWLMARHDFTFSGRAYTTGEVFSASPLVAVQLQARRSVTFAKQPPLAPTETVEPPAAPPRRRGRPPRIMTAAGSALVAAPVSEAPAAEPVVTQVTHNLDEGAEIDLSSGTYARKDLRAED